MSENTIKSVIELRINILLTKIEIFLHEKVDNVFSIIAFGLLLLISTFSFVIIYGKFLRFAFNLIYNYLKLNYT